MSNVSAKAKLVEFFGGTSESFDEITNCKLFAVTTASSTEVMTPLLLVMVSTLVVGAPVAGSTAAGGASSFFLAQPTEITVVKSMARENGFMLILLLSGSHRPLRWMSGLGGIKLK